MTVWTPQQNEALSLAGAWLRLNHTQVFKLFGYAGSGKTSLAMHLAEHANGPVAFGAYTGKAASVMKQKGCHKAKTIHRMIYESHEDPTTGKFVSTLRHPQFLDRYSLIIIDECSMVDETVGKDLMSFGKPILVLGDPAQLPPVNGGGFFTNQKPDYMLTEVHRQASESPIIRLATEIRQGKFQPRNTDEAGLTICNKKDLNPTNVTDADIVNVGRNDTRMRYNARMREILKRTDALPMKGEPVICLRNDKETPVYNGEIFEVLARRANKATVRLTLKGEDDDPKDAAKVVSVRKEFFDNDMEAQKIPFDTLRDTQRFTYGYAITGHKSQGSQWKNVCVFDESGTFKDNRARWLYTAVTRASEHLTLVV